MTDAVMPSGAAARKTVSPVVEAAKEAVVTAVLVFLLSIYMVGFQTAANQGQQLTFTTQILDVVWACILVPAGRFLIALDRQGLSKPAMAGGLIGFIYLFGIGALGLAGLLDLGYVAFYAVGAYTYAKLATEFGFDFWACLPVAGIVAASFGVVLGFPVLRLRGDYLAIVTLGFGEMIRIILINWGSFTGGPNGLTSIPRPSFFGMPFAREADAGSTTFDQFFGLAYSPLHRLIFLYFIVLGLALLTNAFTLRIRRLPVGRAWEALREDEIAAKALGINPTNTKLTAFAIGAMFAGFAGSFFATRQGFISPESFNFLESAVILAIVVLGGMGSQIGVVVAAIVLVMLPELGRDFAQYRMLLFGAAMIAIMVWRPHGLLARRAPSIRMNRGRPRQGGKGSGA